ncbi:hypothetical protein T07_9364 [Trichinella nelsoni]|uniref:Uncharacterized protein n=1 Tax=Trichinella nelsoni TaxID=6336 RepID=A0A0V0RFM0_9BILA|nr:hypothetical protein T07_9364 [Trichinella nelsoni]
MVAISLQPQGCCPSAIPLTSAPLPQDFLPLPLASPPQRLSLPVNARLEHSELSPNALFLGSNFDRLRETIRSVLQDSSFDGVRGESSFELLQQETHSETASSLSLRTLEASTSGHRNRPSPGRAWPSLRPTLPHQYGTE